jgi:hypothetical protein
VEYCGDLPNGQKSQYAYFDNIGDQRVKQIKNLDPSSGVISQFDYTFKPGCRRRPKWGLIFTFDISAQTDQAVRLWRGLYGLNLKELFII